MQRVKVREKASNYHFLALCVILLMEAGCEGMVGWGRGVLLWMCESEAWLPCIHDSIAPPTWKPKKLSYSWKTTFFFALLQLRCNTIQIIKYYSTDLLQIYVFQAPSLLQFQNSIYEQSYLSKKFTISALVQEFLLFQNVFGFSSARGFF